MEHNISVLVNMVNRLVSGLAVKCVKSATVPKIDGENLIKIHINRTEQALEIFRE
jgi:hypothetical protein